MHVLGSEIITEIKADNRGHSSNKSLVSTFRNSVSISQKINCILIIKSI
jgi:hypothetical protein